MGAVEEVAAMAASASLSIFCVSWSILPRSLSWADLSDARLFFSAARFCSSWVIRARSAFEAPLKAAGYDIRYCDMGVDALPTATACQCLKPWADGTTSCQSDDQPCPL